MIPNYSCDKEFITVTPVFKIEREKLGTNSILRKVDDRVYICTCFVKYVDYQDKPKH